jgi:hypothetical protein
MRVLFCYLGPGEGHPDLTTLFRTVVELFPEDSYCAVCLEPSVMSSWNGPENLQVITFPRGLLREWTRFRLSFAGLGRLAREKRADVIWAHNRGLYRRGRISGDRQTDEQSGRGREPVASRRCWKSRSSVGG